MLIEQKSISEVLTKENRVRQQINEEVNKLLDISEERKRVVADFLFWIINPNHVQASPDPIVKTRELVFSDPKLELAVSFVGSRLALCSEAFAGVFRGTIKPSPRLSEGKTVRRVLTLFRKGANLSEIVSQNSLSLIEVFYLIRRLKSDGQAKIKVEQESSYQLDELNLAIASDWLKSLPKNQIMENHNLRRGRFDNIINKLIELGSIKKRRLALTQWERKQVDEIVASLSSQGMSKNKIAKLLKTTDGIIRTSIRRLRMDGRIAKKQMRFSEEDWQNLTREIIPLRANGLTWTTIEQQQKISAHRCRVISKRLRQDLIKFKKH